MITDFELYCSKFSKHGINISNEIFDKLQAYSEYLIEYNNNVNLTAITEPSEIMIKHFLDSILLEKYVDIEVGSSLIDVGTGAGFPSVPLKIYRPDLKITLLDSLNKRIDFLRLLCEKLEIDAEFIHGRAEDVAKMPEYREKFDFSTARAVANLSTLSEYCIPFIKVGGKFIALKGPSESPFDAENSIRILGGQVEGCVDYTLENESRRIITISKISQTPSKYPRNSAQIKKKPL